MNKNIKGFLYKGWIVRSHSAWVARGFLVRKPGTNKWSLVIDYRYPNPCLQGNEFPLPVIEDLLQGQAGNHIWTLLHLEDGFHQMPPFEERRHLTAFCTPAGTFGWNVLPMGVEVGPQAFQRLVSWCVGRLKPHIRAYVDDILVGTRPTCSCTMSPVLGQPPRASRSHPVKPGAQAPGVGRGTTASGKPTGAPRGTGPDEARHTTRGHQARQRSTPLATTKAHAQVPSNNGRRVPPTRRARTTRITTAREQVPSNASRRPDGRMRARRVPSPYRPRTAAVQTDECAPGG